jgi:hypothetical protein
MLPVRREVPIPRARQLCRRLHNRALLVTTAAAKAQVTVLPLLQAAKSPTQLALTAVASVLPDVTAVPPVEQNEDHLPQSR